MGTKETLAGLLAAGGEEYISGEEIARKLGVSRGAVWKSMKALEKEGYKIEAVPNKGYRLSAENDRISLETLTAMLGDAAELFSLEVYDSTDSTNTRLKSRAEELPDWSVAVAGAQTAGRGRVGRSFFSPAGTGLYLSVLLKQRELLRQAGNLTTAAAVAACHAIETCTDARPGIKWVNDVFVEGKKVCGILTEASVNFETGAPDWAVMGIGFNVYVPEGGFPEEVAQVAGAITAERKKNLRVRLAAAFLRAFYEVCAVQGSEGLYAEYRARCFVPGKQIYVLRGDKKIPALALDIRQDYALLVQYEDGTQEALTAGEVSIRPTEPRWE
ncbi:MAG: biotin--[acetyl-CoA-carboxylase] ligase [Lachnospiraceae bacterium]|nr:biotin--[acetyl-CoA-carboxylase] ligase [Lachnospiraceae bacterium]